MDDEELLLLQSRSQYYRGETSADLRKKLNYYLPTAWMAIVEILFIMVYVVLVMLPFELPESKTDITISSYQVKAGVGIFMLVLNIGFYRLRNLFHRRARRRGYLRFYRQTRVVSKVTPICWAMHVAVIAIVSTMWTDTPTNEIPLHVIQASAAVAAAIVVAAMIYYIVLVVRFNRIRALPDAAGFHNPDIDLPEANDGSSSPSMKRINDDQAEYIRYLLEQNRTLSMRISALTGRSGGDVVVPVQAPPRRTSISQGFGARERLTHLEGENDTIVTVEPVVQPQSVNSEKEALVAEVTKLREYLNMEKQAATAFQDIIVKQRAEIERLTHLHDNDDG